MKPSKPEDSLPYSVSHARANLYQLVDQVLETGEPAYIKRNGRVVRMVADAPVRKLELLDAHPDYIVGNADDLVHLDWSTAWKPAV
ncbi:MAG: type II toxin-antitoxin system Phd/YefM family antitoxin [Nevskiaceae bacterium]|nr:MAG: type II toxin-antitoxin system Phd/YefM family antitoxin [Nevskiaceae bacterium]TBR73554.1 MAG: type II toxin-antitoxin system Phd/YefM family antitoxin [Nevskiaceae bacterium]